MTWCPKCNEEQESGARFCPECGVELNLDPTSKGEVLPETSAEAERQQSGALPLSQEGLSQKRFSLLPGEKIIIDGRFTYYYGYNSLVKGGTTYLTQFRLVFCNNHSIFVPALLGGIGVFLTAMLGYKSELWFLLFLFSRLRNLSSSKSHQNNLPSSNFTDQVDK